MIKTISKVNLIVCLAVALLFAGAAIERFERPDQVQAQGNIPGQFTYISTATTTLAKDQAGYLVGVTINGGTAGVVTLFDIGRTGCTGTPGSGKFATIETISATSPVHLAYNLRFTNGLCVLTAANTDLTVTWN
jgi:hypothetical protein